ncbi:hypothetical protein [Xylophilus sp. ASV27]|uniref:hypothetical protein n=1 Tax=Xylophilus sp. ASV27 TaxID=2795129 RepID=UPI0018ECE6D0|nr:hypothetical protein [Xylophilus sp. ASV27]
MKEFSMRPGMQTLAGTFYPTGHAVVMFPQEQQARQAAEDLMAEGFSDDDVELLRPDVMLREVLASTPDEADGLPSVGTEAATARTFGDLARQGHYGLLVAVNDAKAAERLMTVARRLHFSAAQRYRHLVIEELS